MYKSIKLYIHTPENKEDQLDNLSLVQDLNLTTQ